MGRRTFLAGVVATTLAAGCSNEAGAPPVASGDDLPPEPAADLPPETAADLPPETAADLPPLPTSLPVEMFALGVASGDPLPGSVILWTRLVNDPLAGGGGVPDQPLPVRWEVAADDGFDDIVASGDVVAEPALAHAVHIDASGLEPDSWYWYRFSVGSSSSPVGRTRTAPASGAEVERLRFAFASCQNYQAGYWPAHDHIAGEDIDLVVFLGDYIYEDPPRPTARRTAVTEAPVDLAGYRRRYGEYKADPALQRAHAHVPWVCTWDDHEVQDNYSGNYSPLAWGDVAALRARRAAAYQAYYEHMPVRMQPPAGPDVTLYRSLAWGALARFYVLDGRQYRSDQACGAPPDPMASCDALAGMGRTMLGDEQEAWLDGELAATDATWNVVAQQTIVSRLVVPLGGVESFNVGYQWDGYPAARQRLVDSLREVDNPVIITGDIHASAVSVVTDDPDDPSSPAIVPELVGTSISSTFPTGIVGEVQTAATVSPTMRYVEPSLRGYVVCEVTPDALEAAFRYVSSTATQDADVTTGARWVISAGDSEPRPVVSRSSNGLPSPPDSGVAALR